MRCLPCIPIGSTKRTKKKIAVLGGSTTNDIIKTKPFPLIVKIVDEKKEVLVNQVFKVNQWSGDNIVIRVVE